MCLDLTHKGFFVCGGGGGGGGCGDDDGGDDCSGGDGGGDDYGGDGGVDGGGGRGGGDGGGSGGCGDDGGGGGGGDGGAVAFSRRLHPAGRGGLQPEGELGEGREPSARLWLRLLVPAPPQRHGVVRVGRSLRLEKRL